jgi:hypothetical protein
LRDILGNPFHSLPPRKGNHAWEEQKRRWMEGKEGTVCRLAEGIYREHRFEDLAILADALRDVGCTEAAILDHLRAPGPHVRGCWVVDLLLGKRESADRSTGADRSHE